MEENPIIENESIEDEIIVTVDSDFRIRLPKELAEKLKGEDNNKVHILALPESHEPVILMSNKTWQDFEQENLHKILHDRKYQRRMYSQRVESAIHQGKVRIPKQIQKRKNISKGTKFRVHKEEDQFILEKIDE